MQDWLHDGQQLCVSGVNTATRPQFVPDGQLVWAKNLTVRDATPETRPSLVQRGAALPAGNVQGAGYFSINEGQFILSISGQLWRLRFLGANPFLDPIPLEFRNSAFLPTAWMCETNGSFLVQDGESAAIIYDGAEARRSNIFANEVPIGRQMAYGNGRLWIVDRSGRNVLAGDITTDMFQSELLFTETEYLNGGGAFYFVRPLTALAFLPVNNTFSGLGSLVVFGQDQIFTLAAQNTARDTWSDTSGFQNFVLPLGAASQTSVIPVNQDLYFCDPSGAIWSLRQAVADAGSPGNTPVSREVSRIVDFETKRLIPFTSGIYHRNRIIFSSSPFYNLYGRGSFKSLISLDVAPASTMRAKQLPAYDGEWTGLQFKQVFQGKINGVDRAFIISTDSDGENRLWEFTDGVVDRSYRNTQENPQDITLQDTAIATSLEYRRFDFQSPGLKKQLMRVDFWPADIQGPVTVYVWWRVDNDPQWYYIGQVLFCATMENSPGEWNTLAPQERALVKTLTLPEAIGSITKQATSVGYAFQIRLGWTGRLSIDKMVAHARPLDLTQFGNTDKFDSACVKQVVTFNDLSHVIPVGGLGEPYTDESGEAYTDSYELNYTGSVAIV